MKLQPYPDFWVSEIEMDFSCPACVLLWCLSVPLCLLPPSPLSLVFLSRPLRCQSNPPERAATPFLFFYFVLPPLLLPPQNPCFSIPGSPNMPCFPYFLECQCATCWHCAWMITCLYIVIIVTPIPPGVDKRWFECCTDSGFSVHLRFSSDYIFFFFKCM